MDMFSLLMQILSTVLSVYMLLILIRILLSWFSLSSGFPQGASGSGKGGQVRAFLEKITNPYLHLFRNISWLRWGMLDFSGVIGIALLGLGVQITSTLARTGYITIGNVFVYIVLYAWRFAAFFLSFLVIMMLVRLVTLIWSKKHHPFFDRMDTFLFPLVSRVMGIFTKRTVSYSLALGVSAGLFLGFRVGMNFLIQYLISLLGAL